ncbi:hypothetical protein V8C86DRAFT_2438700 [Haematococcus lacustris]
MSGRGADLVLSPRQAQWLLPDCDNKDQAKQTFDRMLQYANPNTIDPTIRLWFADFKRYFSKEYYSSDAEQAALLNFAQTMEKVRATNTNTSIPYWLAGNQYADLDFLSFKALILMRTPTPQPTSRKLRSGVRDAGLHTGRQLQQALPAEVNWLAQGKVSAVKNQGGCGSCWAFAAVAALESAYLIARPGRTAAGPPPLHLSEQQIVSCVNAAAGYSSQGCNGGSSSDVFNYAARHNVTLDTVYPYSAGFSGSSGVCSRSILSNTQAGQVVQLASGGLATQPNSEVALQQAVARQPTVVYFEVDDQFMSYRGGVYRPRTCTNRLNHAMVVEGYSTAGRYWLLRNSWGAFWGEGGYARVQMTVTRLCMAHLLPGTASGPCGMYLANGAAHWANNHNNTWHAKKVKRHTLMRGVAAAGVEEGAVVPSEVVEARLVTQIEAWVEACSKRALLASLLLGLMVRDSFTRVTVLADGLYELLEETPAEDADIPDFAERNLFLQLGRGLPPPGIHSQPSAAVEDVLIAYPDLHAELDAIPRYPHDCNTVDDVGQKLETSFANSLTELFKRRVGQAVALAGARVIAGSHEHQRRFGLPLDGSPAWTERQRSWVVRSVRGKEVTWLEGQGGVVPTEAMRYEVARQRRLLGVGQGVVVNKAWRQMRVNRGSLLRHAVDTSRQLEAAHVSWQLDWADWQALGGQPNSRPYRPPSPFAITPSCSCKAHHIKLDTRAIYGLMRAAGMLPADITSLTRFRNGVAGPRDSEVANRWLAFLPSSIPPAIQPSIWPNDGQTFAQVVHTDGVTAPQRERVTLAALPASAQERRASRRWEAATGDLATQPACDACRRQHKNWKDQLSPDINMGVPSLMLILEPNIVWEHTHAYNSAVGSDVEAHYCPGSPAPMLAGDYFDGWHRGGRPAHGVYEGSYWELLGNCDALVDMLRKMSRAPPLEELPQLQLPDTAELPKWEDFKPALQPLPAEPTLPTLRLPVFRVPILDTEAHAALAPAAQVPFLEPDYLELPDVPDMAREERLPIFFPPELMVQEPFDEPEFIAPEPPTITAAPQAPVFGKPQYGHDWTGSRPFTVELQPYVRPKQLEVPRWVHPPRRLPKLPLADELQLDQAELELEPIPKLELAWWVWPLHAYPQSVASLGHQTLPSCPDRISRPSTATPRYSSSSGSRSTSNTRPGSAQGPGQRSLPSPQAVRPSAAGGQQSLPSSPGDPQQAAWEGVAGVEAGRPCLWLNFNKPFAELPPVFIPPRPEMGVSNGPEPQPQDYPVGELEQLPEFVMPTELHAPSWEPPTLKRGKFNSMKDCACELLQPQGELATAASAFDVIAFSAAAYAWSATFSQRLSLLSSSQLFYTGRQAGGKITAGSRAPEKTRAGAQMMPTEPDLLDDARKWVENWPDATGQTTLLSAFLLADEHWNADCWYLMSDGRAHDPMQCIAFLEDRIKHQQRVPIIHTVGFFTDEASPEGRQFLQQLSTLTGGTFQEYRPTLNRIYKEGQGFVKYDTKAESVETCTERKWAEEVLRGERKKNIRLGIQEPLDVTIARVQALHNQLRVQPLVREHTERVAGEQAAYEAELAKVVAHNTDLKPRPSSTAKQPHCQADDLGTTFDHELLWPLSGGLLPVACQARALREYQQLVDAVTARNQAKVLRKTPDPWPIPVDHAKQRYEQAHAEWETSYRVALADWEKYKTSLEAEREEAIAALQALERRRSRTPSPPRSRPGSARQSAGQSRPSSARTRPPSAPSGAAAASSSLSHRAAGLRSSSQPSSAPALGSTAQGKLQEHEGEEEQDGGDVFEEVEMEGGGSELPELELEDSQELKRRIHPPEVVKDLDVSNAGRLDEIRGEWARLLSDVEQRNRHKLDILARNQDKIDAYVAEVVGVYADSYVREALFGAATRIAANKQRTEAAEAEYAAQEAFTIAENARLAQAHAAEVEDKVFREEQFRLARERWERGKTEAWKEHEAAVTAAKAHYAENVAQLRAEWQQQKEEVQRVNAVRMAEAEAYHACQVEEVMQVNKRHKQEYLDKIKERKAVEAENLGRLAEARTAHNAKLSALSRDNEERLRMVQQEHAALCERLSMEHEEACEVARHEFEELKAFLTAHNDSLTDEARKKYAEAVASAQADFAAQCDALRASHALELERVRQHNEAIWPQVQVARLAQAELARVQAFAEHIRYCANKLQLGVNFMPNTPNYDRVVEMQARGLTCLTCLQSPHTVAPGFQALTEALVKAFPELPPHAYPWPGHDQRLTVGTGWTTAPAAKSLTIPDPTADIKRIAAGLPLRPASAQRPHSAHPSLARPTSAITPRKPSASPHPELGGVERGGSQGSAEPPLSLARPRFAAFNAGSSEVIGPGPAAHTVTVPTTKAQLQQLSASPPGAARGRLPSMPSSAEPTPEDVTAAAGGYSVRQAGGQAVGGSLATMQPVTSATAKGQGHSHSAHRAHSAGAAPSPWASPVQASPNALGYRPRSPTGKPVPRPVSARTPVPARMSADLANLQGTLTRFRSAKVFAGAPQGGSPASKPASGFKSETGVRTQVAPPSPV